MRARVASLLPILSFALLALALAPGCAGLTGGSAEPPPPSVVDERGACAISGLCVAGYAWSMDACGCVPGTACGPSICAPGLSCCNASCGLCAAPGEVCSQQVCEAPPPAPSGRRR